MFETQKQNQKFWFKSGLNIALKMNRQIIVNATTEMGLWDKKCTLLLKNDSKC